MTDTTYREPDASLVTITTVTYALHALGLAIGAFGTASVVGAFLFGWPSIIAVIINYVKRDEARGASRGPRRFVSGVRTAGARSSP